MRDDIGQRTPHDGGPKMAQLAQRRRVEGARLSLWNTQLGQAVAHFEGRTLREGHGEHVGRVEGANSRPVRDAVRDRTGLAGARTRQDGERARHLRGDGALIGVQGVQQFLGVHGPHCPIAHAQLRPAPSGPLGSSSPYHSRSRA